MLYSRKYAKKQDKKVAEVTGKNEAAMTDEEKKAAKKAEFEARIQSLKEQIEAGSLTDFSELKKSEKKALKALGVEIEEE